MQQVITVGDLIALNRHGLIQEWLWRNWNKAQKKGDKSLLSETVRDYEFSRMASLSVLIMGILYVYVTFALLKWYEHSMFVSLVLFIMLVEVLRKYFKKRYALSRFASDLYLLRTYLYVGFDKNTSLDEIWVKGQANEAEARKALATLLQQAADPRATSIRNEFEQQHQLFLRFKLVSDGWEPAFRKAEETFRRTSEVNRLAGIVEEISGNTLPR